MDHSQEEQTTENTQPAMQEAKPVDMTHCPTCSRKLLTQTSALCNWCGAKIDIPEYQENAAKARLEQDEAERAQVEAIMQEESRYGTLGRLRRRAKADRGSKNNNPLL